MLGRGLKLLGRSKESPTRCLCSDSRVSFEDTHLRRVLSSKRASTAQKQAAAYALQIE